MMSIRPWDCRAVAIFATTFLIFLEASLWAANLSSSHSAKIPESLITTETKQVYRFHFSSLQGTDAVRFAGQLLPMVAMLPTDNPFRQTLADASDRGSFLDDFRSLRASFLDAGVDTIYFIADAFWIESSMLSGRVVMVGDEASRDRLQRRLQAAGHELWAGTVARLRPVPKSTGWLVGSVGAPVDASPSPERYALVNHALSEVCPIQPAMFETGSLPTLRIMLNQATPVTVVNLEPSKLEDVLTKMLKEIVPASGQVPLWIPNAKASTIAASIHPMTYVRQVTHMKTPAEAAKLAALIQQQINGATQRIVDLDEELGPLLGWFAKSMVLVSALGSDVHLVMKPPGLFDLGLAQSKSDESQDMDWTALPAPGGYHWEVAGALGVADRRDVFARTHAVRVRGGSSTVTAEDPTTPLARFRIPFADNELVLFRNLKGQLKVDVAGVRSKTTSLPALELLDDRGRLAAVLRLDLQQGDPRFDLARTRAVLAQRINQRKENELKTKRAVDAVENENQRAQLEGSFNASFAAMEQAQAKLNAAYREHRYEQAARVVFQELDDEARMAQRQHPGATLVKDNASAISGRASWAMDRQRFPFAGQWLFDFGVLTLFQDARGAVAGVFATKVFHNTADMTIDQNQSLTGSAILVGQSLERDLPFTMYDHRGRERKGKLTLNPDGTGGKWSLASTENEAMNPLAVKQTTGPAPGTAPRKRDKGLDVNNGKPKGKPMPPMPSLPFGTQFPNPLSNPLPLPAPLLNPLQAGSPPKLGGFPQPPFPSYPLGLPPVQRPPRNAEPGRQGVLDRIEIAAPDRLWEQQSPTASFVGYWVHDTDKRMNIVFQREASGLLNGKQGSFPVPLGNLRGAAVGNLLLILENVNMELSTTPSVVAAELSGSGDRLIYMTPRARAPFAAGVNRFSQPMELIRHDTSKAP